MRRLFIIAAALGLVFAAVPLQGQTVATNLNELRLKVRAGDTIYVTTDDGEEHQATVVDLSASSLVIAADGSQTELSEARLRRIRQRVPDRLRNGALIGCLAGAASMTAVVKTLESPKGSCTGGCIATALLAYGGLGALVGVGVDALHKGKATIYEARETRRSLVIEPVLLPAAKAVHVTLRF